MEITDFNEKKKSVLNGEVGKLKSALASCYTGTGLFAETFSQNSFSIIKMQEIASYYFINIFPK